MLNQPLSNLPNQISIEVETAQETSKNHRFHLYLISDATGETLLSAGRAITAQYKNYQVIEHLYTLVRTKEQLSKIFENINQQKGIVLYTVMKEEIAKEIDEFCQKLQIPYVPVLEPILRAFQNYLGVQAPRKVSAQHDLNPAYYKRIDALDYTLNHDDGQMVAGLVNADVILIGISRTSKTPTSLYLANRGIKTANVPLVLDVPLPEELLMIKPQQLIVGLIATPDHISQIRQTREKGLGIKLDSYTDREKIFQELSYARKLCKKYEWPIIDVTRRSIEETAAAILSLYSQKKANFE